MANIATSDLEIVGRLPIFSGLSSDLLAVLLAGARVAEFGAGAVLFMQDDPADRFFAILDGWVKLSRNMPDGNQTVIGIFSRGESFAEAAIFDSSRFPVTAEVVEPARLLVVPAKPFLAALRDDFTIAVNILGSMSRRLRYLVQQLEQLHGKSAPQRVASYLLKLGPEQDETLIVRLPYDKSLIAARLGMKPETFSRALATLKSHGVRTERSAVTIDAPAELRIFCIGDSWM